MTIPEDQLTRWSNQGGTADSIAAHNSIRTALEADDSSLKEKKPEIFLQGSYRNSTNIRADSDVDVVVQFNQVYYRDLSQLPPDQRQLYENTHHNVPYGAVEWRADVEKALRKTFGAALQHSGGKALHVVTGPGNMTADVLPALLFKKYTYYQSPTNEGFDPGVEFADSAGNLTINYPKLHIKNGEAKNSKDQTDGWYKPAVRMFKNARNCTIEKGQVQDGIAPSYFVECLLYNVPKESFGGTFKDTYFNVVKYLLQASLATFRCQNGKLALFGTSSVQWNVADATTFVKELAALWDNWQ